MKVKGKTSNRIGECELDENVNKEQKLIILQPYYAFGRELSIPLNIGLKSENDDYQFFVLLPNDDSRFNEIAAPHIAQNLLLYDEIILPSYAVKPLYLLLGSTNFKALVLSGSVKFFYKPGFFTIIQKKGKPWGELHHMDIVRDENDETGKQQQSKGDVLISDELWALAQTNTIEIQPENVTYDVFNELDKDINEGSLKMDFGLKKTNARDKIYYKEIPSLLLLARLNEVLYSANFLKCDNVYTEGVMQLLLDGKIQEAPYNKIFNITKRLEELPDFQKVFKDNLLSMDDVCKIRNSNACKSFRKWILNLGDMQYTEEEVAKEYVKLLKSESALDKFPLKTLRWLLLSMIPVPGLSFPGAIAESVFSDMLRKRHAKYFLDSLKKSIKTTNNKRG